MRLSSSRRLQFLRQNELCERPSVSVPGLVGQADQGTVRADFQMPKGVVRNCTKSLIIGQQPLPAPCPSDAPRLTFPAGTLHPSACQLFNRPLRMM
jgi:hypothetical protein